MIRLNIVLLIALGLSACSKSTCGSECMEQPDAQPASAQATSQTPAPVPQVAPVAQIAQPAQCITPTTQDTTQTTTQTTTTAAPSVPYCTYEGQVNCIVDGVKFKSVAPSNIYSNCTAEGQGSCVVDGSNFKSIVPSNIYSSCTSDGQGGCVVDGTTFKSIRPSNIDSWNIRSGITIAGVAGKLKVNCRNKIKSSIINYDGALASLPTVGPFNTGTALDIWDTIDDSKLPTEIPSGWSNNICEGMEISGNDNNVWRDVTVANNVASDCTTSPSTCTRKDKITGLFWSGVFAAKTWAQAWSSCTSMTYNGSSGWRLPTQKELFEMSAHGASTTWVASALLWSGTTVGGTPTQAWAIYTNEGQLTSGAKTSSMNFVCVR